MTQITPPSSLLIIQGIWGDIQSAKASIGTAITQAGGSVTPPITVSIVGPMNDFTANSVNALPTTVQVTVSLPNEAAYQTLLTKLATVKTTYPNLLFSVIYNENNSV